MHAECASRSSQLNPGETSAESHDAAVLAQPGSLNIAQRLHRWPGGTSLCAMKTTPCGEDWGYRLWPLTLDPACPLSRSSVYRGPGDSPPSGFAEAVSL